MDNMQNILPGTTLKILINLECKSDPTVTLDTIEWSTEWFTGIYNEKTALKIEKNACVRVEDTVDGVTTVKYFAYVDTADMKAGKVSMRFLAKITDPDATDGVRKEYSEVTTDVVLS